MAGIKTNITDNVCVDVGSWIVQPFESRQIRTKNSHSPICRYAAHTHQGFNRDKYAIFGHTLTNNKTFHIIKQTYVNVRVCVWVYEILNSVDFR